MLARGSLLDAHAPLPDPPPDPSRQHGGSQGPEPRSIPFHPLPGRDRHGGAGIRPSDRAPGRHRAGGIGAAGPGDRRARPVALDDECGGARQVLPHQGGSGCRGAAASGRRHAADRCGLHADQPASPPQCLRQPGGSLRSAGQCPLCRAVPEGSECDAGRLDALGGELPQQHAGAGRCLPRRGGGAVAGGAARGRVGPRMESGLESGLESGWAGARWRGGAPRDGSAGGARPALRRRALCRGAGGGEPYARRGVGAGHHGGRGGGRRGLRWPRAGGLSCHPDPAGLPNAGPGGAEPAPGAGTGVRPRGRAAPPARHARRWRCCGTCGSPWRRSCRGRRRRYAA
ncbi:Uncharacterised protein [Roseomonas gilardii subsp. rosea]|nr:Uncharacterised protein [Roseomonas gilardii subsp. rosea]